jgi:hypothetical protein
MPEFGISMLHARMATFLTNHEQGTKGLAVDDRVLLEAWRVSPGRHWVAAPLPR